jgi:hypothetical protein
MKNVAEACHARRDSSPASATKKKHRQKGGAFLFQRMKNVAELVTHGVIQVLPPLQRKKHRQKAVLFYFSE